MAEKYFSKGKVGILVGKNLQVRIIIWPVSVGESIILVD